MNISDVNNYVRKFNKWLNEQPGYLRAGLVPAAIGLSGLLILAFRSALPLPVQILLFIIYAALLFATAMLNYENSQFGEFQNKRIKLYQASISYINACVTEKTRRVTGPIADGKERDILRTARSVRGRIRIENSVSTMNYSLRRNIAYLLKMTHGETGNIYVSFVTPKDGKFQSFATPSKTSGSVRASIEPHGISIDDSRTMISQLYSENTTLSKSIRSTAEASNRGGFHFFEEAEKEVIKSIYCRKVVNNHTKEIIGFWCIESDREGDFPDTDDTANIQAINEMIDNYAIRLELENSYEKVLEYLDPLLWGETRKNDIEQ